MISRGTRGNAVPIVKVFKNAQERNAAVKDEETFIAQSSTLAFTSLLPSLQTTPFAKNNWKLVFNNASCHISHRYAVAHFMSQECTRVRILHYK